MPRGSHIFLTHTDDASKNITKIMLPYFCCDSVAQSCRNCDVRYDYYHVDIHFKPVIEKNLEADEWLYLVNYYGQLSNEELGKYKKKYDKIIVDNAQAYYQEPLEGTDTIYTCRKFFGVCDGAFLYTDSCLEGLEQDESFERVHYILGRFERNASEFYEEASNNNKIFQNEPLKRMSKLTENMLRAIDYDTACKRRTENFAYLHEKLHDKNGLEISVPTGAFMYPLYIENGAEIRKRLQGDKIYVPTLWPDVFNICKKSDLEYDMAANILPLPVDQRYDLRDMEWMCQRVLSRANEVIACLS